MQKLIIVSNRLPISVSKEEGKLTFTESIGGLATGLKSFVEKNESIWVGWPGLTAEEVNAEERQQIEEHLRQRNFYPVFLSEEQVQKFYYGFCNDTIWPLFHYFHLYTQFDEGYWQSYQEVNTLFAEAVASIASADDTIWIQDYHFLLLPQMVRDRVLRGAYRLLFTHPIPVIRDLSAVALARRTAARAIGRRPQWLS